MESNQDLLDMIKGLEKTNRQQLKYAKIRCLFSIMSAVFCLILLLVVCSVIPQVQQFTTQVQELATQADTVLTNLDTVAQELAEVDLDTMVTNVDSLVTTSQTAVEEAVEKLNAIDIDTLNQAIEDLSDVVDPLAKFFNKFN